MKIISRISHYPQPLIDGIMISAKYRSGAKIRRHLPLHRFDTAFDTESPPIVETAKDLKNYPARWIFATMKPCLFFTATKFDANGKVEMAFAKHISLRNFEYWIPIILSPFDSPENLFVSFAGFGERSSSISLKRDSEILLSILNDFGFSFRLTYNESGQPFIVDRKTQNIVSDIGLGLIRRDDPEDFYRSALFGVARNGSMLLSFHHFNGNHEFQTMQAITQDKGLISLPLD